MSRERELAKPISTSSTPMAARLLTMNFLSVRLKTHPGRLFAFSEGGVDYAADILHAVLLEWLIMISIAIRMPVVAS